MFLEISLNSQENTFARVSFLQPQAYNFIKIESLTQAFSCEFCKHLYKNTFFYRTPPLATSAKACNFTKIRFAGGCFFVDILKMNVFLMQCKNFLKVHKNTGEKMFAKYLSADDCFVKTIILLTVMITAMLPVS